MNKVTKIFEASDSQCKFINSEAIFPAFVGGYGSGKTMAGLMRIIKLKFECPGQNVLYLMPSYSYIKKVAFPEATNILNVLGVKFTLNKSDKVINIKQGIGNIIFISMDNPNDIIAINAAHAILDELDTLKTDDAEVVFNKTVARCRLKLSNNKPNTIAPVTTPEGFGFMYKNFDPNQAPLDNSKLIHGSTYDNQRNLQPGYIDNLKRVYPAKVLEAYLNGQFVNMTSGCVYDVFDRDIHKTTATLQHSEPVHIGMDFNVRNMHATAHVIRAGKIYAIDELVKIKDTPTIINVIKQRYTGHKIFIYPDASNPGSTLDASASDINLLKSSGLTVIANSINPRIKDRILSLYTAIEKKRYAVNVLRCPTLALSLENQTYDKNGVPDKKAGFDHILDATGYFVVKAIPIKAPRWKSKSNTIHTI